MKKFLLTLITIIFFTGMAVAQQPDPGSPGKIRNGIKLNLSNGIKLVQAYLAFDGGNPVPESNIVGLNQNVNLLVQIERGGWVEKKGKVSIGGSEKVTTSLGSVILNEPDLFAKYTNIKAEDAQFITLKATITSTEKKINYFNVNFKIWDKWGSNKMTGSYKFKVK